MSEILAVGIIRFIRYIYTFAKNPLAIVFNIRELSISILPDVIII